MKFVLDFVRSAKELKIRFRFSVSRTFAGVIVSIFLAVFGYNQVTSQPAAPQQIERLYAAS